MKEQLTRLGLQSLSVAGLPRLMASRHAGEGAILSLHRICQPQPYEFASQAGLSVTPENFRRILQTLIGRRYRFLSMSDLAHRLRESERVPQEPRFICLTFDDGFADVFEEAFPICREFGVTFTVYLVSGFVRREFPMWAAGLEKAIATNDTIEFAWDAREWKLGTRTMREKRNAYFALASRFVTAPPEVIQRSCAELGLRYGIDFIELGSRYALTPAMIAAMKASGLVEFGAHSVSHASLGHLKANAARWEIEQSKRDCEALLGTEVRHFAYPYGDRQAAGPREMAFCREAGYQTAVTTESNTIFASDCDRLLALPRLTYNGKYQNTPLLDLLLSGALPSLRRHLRLPTMASREAR